MNLIYFAAFIAACGAAKLDRTYLPPSSSQYAGGTPGSSQTSGISGLNQAFLQTPFGRTSDNNPSQGNQLPSGSYENEHQGVVVEAAAPGTRASNQPSGLGGPRENYGSTDSKVGAAAFRGTKNQARPQNGGIQNQAQFESISPQGSIGINNQDYPDLSAFHQPSGPVNAGNRPGNQFFTDRVSNTVKYHMNIGLNKFNYGFETENGIKMEENGVSNDGDKRQGGYSYTGDDGKVYSVVYTADKNGYRPMGSHLPTPPPIPVEILESLQQNAKDEANGIKDDGSYDAQKYNAEDDYTQSDTNGNYNDRQSNKFGERPGFNAGAGAVINQNQQGFVRPNGQGHFSSYDFSKGSSSTQPDNSKFGTGIAGFDNKGQPSTGQRPGFNTGAGIFFNQNQQGFVRPNDPFSSYDFSKDLSSTQPDTSKFGISFHGGDNTFNKGNILSQNKQAAQFGNIFGAQSQYLPPRPPGNFLDANSFLQIDSSKVGFNNNFNNAQPHSEQKFQDQGPFGKPIQTLTTQNSYGTFFGQGSSNKNLPPSVQGSNSFGVSINNNKPQNDGAFFQTGLQNPSIGSNLGLEFDGKAQTSPVINGNNGSFYISGLSQENMIDNPQSQGSLSTPALNVGITSQNNVNNIPLNQDSFFQTSLQSTGDSTKENTNLDFNNRFSPTVSSQTIPTKQPDLILTTPLESQEQQTNSFSSAVSTSSTGDSQSILSSNERPSDGSNLPGQLDISSVFSTQYQSTTGSDKHPQPPTLTPITPTLPTKEDETETNTYQSNGITQASISSFPSITPTSSSQTSSGEVYEYTKPAQGLPASSQGENTDESNSEVNQPSSVFSTQNENTIKPQLSTESNTQFGQSFPFPSTSTFGQQTTPSRFGVQTGSTFGQKPSQSQLGEQETFGAQTSSVFGQKPIQQQSGSQSSFLFGQQTTPTRLTSQTSSSFGQKPTLSPFSGQTSTSLNQQTIPSRFGVQTSSPFGLKPTQPQASFEFGQQTTPSRFGVQTSSSFGQRPTLSPFSTQTTSSFGQKQTTFSFGQQTMPTRFGTQTSSTSGQNPSQPGTGPLQTSFLFGSQTTPSRFDVHQTGSSIAQKPRFPSVGTSLNQQTISSCCSQTSSSFGQQTTPSRFDIQTSSTFGQKPTQQQLGGQTSFVFGSQTTPSRFGAQPSSSFGQQTTPSPFGVQTSTLFEQKTTPSQTSVQAGSSGQQTPPSRFGVQSGSGNGQQTTLSPFGVQTSSTFEQKITVSQFDDSSSEQQSTAQFGGDLNKQQQSQSEESNEQSENQSDAKPSTLQPSTSNSQNSQESVENTSSDEIYQYNKPTTGFPSNGGNKAQINFGSQQSLGNQFGQGITSSEKENEATFGLQSTVQPVKQFGSQLPQFGTKPNNQFGIQTESASDEKDITYSQQSQGNTQFQQSTTQSDKQSFSSTSLTEDVSKPNQQSQVAIFPRFPEQSKVTNSPFESGQPTISQFFFGPTSSLGQSFGSKESTSPKISSTSTDNTEYQPSTLLPSSPNSQNSFNLQKQEQSQNSQSGELYQYNKPAQSLPDASQNKFDTNQPITSHLSQSNEKFDNIQPTKGDEDESQPQIIVSKPQTPLSTTLGTLPSAHPFPHLAFYSACCRGPKPQKPQGSSLSGKVPSSPLTGNLGGNTNSFGLNKNDNQDTNGSGLIENKFGNQGLGVQKETPSFTGQGEEFGGPRKPPKFDESGYHY
ncbi:nuclear pore complex protein DDB_G0274915-like isoform X2 [Maniola jurtina]|uniref:nuclear pore complex protein DDB_G0274915-like isoform X2 n=1 Tax=Maniola jurtina TaxID=191418 RepID=UPI001E687915|nr:nuclear pore complex protein DDB_G0274915-like isoform X2 [Maniola jurtina]